MKTRLAARIGTERATRLYRAFLEDLRDRLSSCGAAIEVWWAYWPPEAAFGELVPGSRVFAQRGENLGARMHDAMERVRGGEDRAVAAIGVDAPHLPLAYLQRCCRELDRGADVVLGPAVDGGYYLVATRRPQPGLFDGVAWGTPAVLEETRARADARRLDVVELPPLADVDDIEDLHELRRVIERHPGLLPRTEAELHASEW